MLGTRLVEVPTILPSRIDDRGVPVRQSGHSRVAVPVATRCAVLAVHECLDDTLEVAFWEVDLAICMRPKPGFSGGEPLASVVGHSAFGSPPRRRFNHGSSNLP